MGGASRGRARAACARRPDAPRLDGCGGLSCALDGRRRAQRASGGRGRAYRGPASRVRGGRQRQDAGHHLPDREPRGLRERAALAHPRGDVHEQGRRRDARTPRAAVRARDGAGALGGDVPRHVRQALANPRRSGGRAAQLRHLRRGGPEGRRRPRAQGARSRRAALPAASRPLAHPQAQAGGARAGRGRGSLVRRRRRAPPLPHVRGAPPRGERGGLRRPHPPGGTPPRKPSGGREDPPALRLRPRRRVSGHERDAVPLPARARARPR